MLLPDGAFLVERRTHDFGGRRLVTDHDLDGGARLRCFGRDVCHADTLPRGRADDAARHDTARLTVDAHAVAVPREAALLHHEADAFLPAAAPLQLRERAPADEVALVELDDPAEARLERRVVLVEVVAVQRVAHLEAERVTGAEADRQDAVVRAGEEKPAPEGHRVVRRDVQLEAILARVARAADDG